MKVCTIEEEKLKAENLSIVSYEADLSPLFLAEGKV